MLVFSSWRGLFAVSVATVAAGILACGPTTPGASDASDESSLTGSSPDAGGGEAATDAAFTLSTSLRVAQLSSDLGSVELCYRAFAAQTFTGPVFASSIAPVDAGTDADAAPASSDSAVSSTDATTAPKDATLDAPGSDSAADVTVTDAPSDGEATPDGPTDGALEPDARDGAALPDAAFRDSGPARDAGSSAGLAFLDVSSYLTIPGAGTFELLVVPAGQAGCSGALLDQEVTLDDGKHSTVVLFGSKSLEAGPGALTLIAITDDATTIASSARTRMFDGALSAARGAPLVVSVAASGAIEDLAIVTPGITPSPNATPPTADALGYHTDAPIVGPAQLRLQEESDGGFDAGVLLWQSAPTNLQLDPGSIHTGFIAQDSIGSIGTVWCNDTSVGSALTSCALLPR